MSEPSLSLKEGPFVAWMKFCTIKNNFTAKHRAMKSMVYMSWIARWYDLLSSTVMC